MNTLFVFRSRIAKVCPAFAHAMAHSLWYSRLAPLITQQAGSMTSPMMEPGPVFVADDAALDPGDAAFAAFVAAFSCATAVATSATRIRSVPAMPALDILIPFP